MLHEDIFFNSYCKYIKLNFWLVICIAKNFIWTTLKAIFSIFRYSFLHPLIPDLQIVVSQTNIVWSQQTIHQWKAMFENKIEKNDPYDWFCSPVSYIWKCWYLINVLCFKLCFLMILKQMVCSYFFAQTWENMKLCLHEHRLVSFSLIVVF